MTDFLDNLRNDKNGNSKKQQLRNRSGKNKKKHNSTQKSYSDRFSNRNFQKLKRAFIENLSGNQRSVDEITPSLLAEAIDSLNSNLEKLSENQKHLVNAQKRTVDMMERQEIEIKKILEHIDVN